MSTWPTSPVWNDPTLINSGNMYESADGVTADDFNAIIENLMYLVQTDRIIEANSLPTTDIDTKALYLYNGSYYRYTESGNWLRYLVPAGTLNINANGTYSITEYSAVEVNVPIPEGYIKPAGTRTITSNGTYDITVYANVEIKIPMPTIIKAPRVLTSNDSYTAAQFGADGISEFTVDVPSAADVTLIEKEVTENGDYYAYDDGADGYSRFVVNVVGGGVIEVTELPTENIRTDTLYQIGDIYYKYEGKLLSDIVGLMGGQMLSFVQAFKQSYGATVELYYSEDVTTIPDDDIKSFDESVLLVPCYYNAATNDVNVYVNEYGWITLSMFLTDLNLDFANGGAIESIDTSSMEEGKYYALLGDNWKSYASGDMIIEVETLPEENIIIGSIYKVGDTYYKYASGAGDFQDVILVDPEAGAQSFKELAEAEGITDISFNMLDTITDTTIPDKVSNLTSGAYHFYYSEDINITDIATTDVLFYLSKWYSLSMLFGGTYLGIISNIGDADTSLTGYYIIGGSSWTELVEPKGVLYVEANGSYDVSNKRSVVVSIPKEPTVLLKYSSNDLPTDAPSGTLAIVLGG